MLYCEKCGQPVEYDKNFCSNCGEKIQNIEKEYTTENPTYRISYDNTERNDKANILLIIIVFFIPIIGLILFIIFNKNKPKLLKSIGISALAGFSFYMVVSMVIVGMFCYYLIKAMPLINYYNDYYDIENYKYDEELDNNFNYNYDEYDNNIFNNFNDFFNNDLFNEQIQLPEENNSNGTL